MTGRLIALCQALGLGDEPQAVLRPLRALYARIDAAIDRGAAGLDLPCKMGCDACCHESVFLSAPEFLAVVDELLRTRSAPALSELLTQMSAIAERFEDELEMLEAFEPGPERDAIAAAVKFRCPLLGADGACTVYASRELNGRTFGQSFDRSRGEPYGCELTHARLRVLGPADTLVDARDARRRLVAAVPGTEVVHVYPWWFRRFGEWIA